MSKCFGCFALFLSLFLLACAKKDEVKIDVESYKFKSDFTTTALLDSFWLDASQASPPSQEIENQKLKITTRGSFVDRVKVKTKKSDFGIGEYKWSIFCSERTIGDRCSIGAFLYLDDSHELDFEIGSGQVDTRTTLNAQSDDLLVYCTSQKFPFSSEPFLIKHNQWHEFKIFLSKDDSNNYLVSWSVDNLLLKELSLEYGESDALFQVFCSLENLNFIGDQLPVKDYDVLFDWFTWN